MTMLATPRSAVPPLLPSCSSPAVGSGAPHRFGVLRLAAFLRRTAPKGPARLIEALAAVHVNRQLAAPDAEQPSLGSRCSGVVDWGAGPSDDPATAVYLRVARRALSGSLSDPTEGATAYHRIDCRPEWARRRTQVAAFGDFLFY